MNDIYPIECPYCMSDSLMVKISDSDVGWLLMFACGECTKDLFLLPVIKKQALGIIEEMDKKALETIGKHEV